MDKINKQKKKSTKQLNPKITPISNAKKLQNIRRINEKKLKNYPEQIFLEQTEKILNQMKKGVCRVFAKKGQGTGFFCKIPLSQDKYLEVFMTNNHVIDKDYLDKKNEIIISLKDDKYIQSINLKNKIKYTNEIYDTTIIILDKDAKI